ncbi:DUF559 domain-containing protein [Pseudarthrobacter enclensis]|uniref:DUF559 domain-containing protein n=1 Tax=Pseudarthrobacter enclensis TaxID=993070 RepID=UPI0027BAB9BB|nr:DUF559 domain-containing protein [Pseudarthrobacter enclensis]
MRTPCWRLWPGPTFGRQGFRFSPRCTWVGWATLICCWRAGWVELDGRHHAEWKQVQKDHRRNNESVLQGYTALRYYYSDVVYHPAAMVSQVLQVLSRRR